MSNLLYCMQPIHGQFSAHSEVRWHIISSQTTRTELLDITAVIRDCWLALFEQARGALRSAAETVRARQGCGFGCNKLRRRNTSSPETVVYRTNKPGGYLTKNKRREPEKVRTVRGNNAQSVLKAMTEGICAKRMRLNRQEVSNGDDGMNEKNHNGKRNNACHWDESYAVKQHVRTYSCYIHLQVYQHVSIANLI